MKIKSTLVYKEARYIWRAFFVYGRGLVYLKNRYIVGPRIKHKGVVDRPVETEEYSIHILCSHRDLLMLLWSLASWYKVLPKGMAGQVYVHEDGSFTTEDLKTIHRLLPSAQIVVAKHMDEQCSSSWLNDFPKIREMRLRSHIPLMRKLIDPYFTGDAPYHIIMDTDILWFKNPEEIFSYVRVKSSFATESNTPMVGALAEDLSLIKRKLNSGVVGYAVSRFDLEAIELFLSKLEENFFGHHVEQAGYAHALTNVELLSFERYSLKPREGQVMRHYTGPVREKFWFEGVRKVKLSIMN